MMLSHDAIASLMCCSRGKFWHHFDHNIFRAVVLHNVARARRLKERQWLHQRQVRSNVYLGREVLGSNVLGSNVYLGREVLGSNVLGSNVYKYWDLTYS